MTPAAARVDRRTTWLGFLFLASSIPMLPGDARAVVELAAGFSTTLVAADLSRPVNFDFLPDGRILLVEQMTGRIRVVVPGAASQPDPVGAVSDVGSETLEEGLLGIAVDPRWPVKPFVYVHHTSVSSPNIKVARYELSGDLELASDGALVLDSLSRRDILGDLPHDAGIHNGGTIEFGPDSMLYVALGDDAVGCSAQDIHQLRGKILRLDVRDVPDGPGPVPQYWQMVPPDNPFWFDADPRARLVWHYGLRNPWSFDFDPHTGVMAIADVGENRWEEINLTAESARNFGWPLFEGLDVHFTGCGALDLSRLLSPVHVYGRDSTETATAILGGICHRGDDVAESFPAEYWGNLFFFDFFKGHLRRLVPSGGDWAIAPPVAGQPEEEAWGTGFGFSSRMRFGPDGGLWFVQGPALWRIEYDGVVGIPPPGTPTRVALQLAAHPTPAAGPVTLEFRLAAAATAEVEVFDVAGRRVRRLGGGGVLSAGPQRLVWNGDDDDGVRVRPGVYLARLTSGGEQAVGRLVLVPAGSPPR